MYKAYLAAFALTVGCSATPEPTPPAPISSAPEPVAPPRPLQVAASEAPPSPLPPPRPVVAEEDPIPFHCAGGEIVVAGDRPYCVQARETSFSESVAWCRSNGGLLTAISSPEENRAMQRAFGSPVGIEGSAWIGLAEPREGDWRWATGGSLGFTNWAPGEPNNAGGGEHCGELQAHSGKWNDMPCDAVLPFLCQARGPTHAARKLKCGKETFDAGGILYCFDAARLGSWSDAETACRRQGGALASFRSPAELEAYRAATASRLHSDRAWVGFTDEGHEGTWTTTRGRRPTFTAWRAGEPNNAGGSENCAEWYPADAGWNDVPCNQPHVGICSPR